MRNGGHLPRWSVRETSRCNMASQGGQDARLSNVFTVRNSESGLSFSVNFDRRESKWISKTQKT